MRGSRFIRLLGRSAAATALGLALSGAAAAQTWNNAGQSPEDLRYRLGIIDAEVQALKAQLGASGARSGGGRVSGDAMVRIAELEAEIRRLTGAVEQLGFKIDQIAADATRRFGDIEFRLTELEGGDISNIAEPAPLGGQAAAGGSPAMPAPTLAAPGSSSQTQVAAATPEVSVSEGAALDRAIRDVQQGRFDQAEDRLRTFITDYPDSPLLGEAHYWLGESQFVRGAFQDAARSYLGGYNSDRQGSSAGQNLLKLGVTLGRLGQRREACLTLREVRSQFAGDSRIVSEADSESDRLACG